MENNTTPVSGLLHKEKVAKSLNIVLIMLAVFLLVQVASGLKAYNYIGGGIPSSNTITVTGEGETFATADIAQFSFSVVEEAKTAATAQETATKKMNIALGLLRAEGIEEKDIKTIAYNITPRYDYTRSICNDFGCSPSTQTLRGFEVRQTISVKVREIGKAGTILAKIGEANVSNISDLAFTIDDQDALESEARTMAIQEAEEKAHELADELGVKIVRVVSFNEYNNEPYYSRGVMAMDMAMEESGIGGALPAPEIPLGENKVTSTVNVTYEIR